MVTEQGSYFNRLLQPQGGPLTLLLAKHSWALEQEAGAVGERSLWTIQTWNMAIVSISELSTAELSKLVSCKVCVSSMSRKP